MCVAGIRSTTSSVHNGFCRSLSEGEAIGRRRDYDEGYEDARREMMDREAGPRRSGDGAFTAAVFIKYAAIVILVIIVAYVILRILGVIQSGV